MILAAVVVALALFVTGAVGPVRASSSVVYNGELTNTGFGVGDGLAGITASANIGDPSTWEFYSFCGVAGDALVIEVHRTTSAMDPAMELHFGTTTDHDTLSGLSFVAAADDNNGIPHGVGGIFADPRIAISLPFSGEYTLIVYDFIPLSSPPVFEIHASGISACDQEVDIDIKPGGNPNSINPKSKGKIPVAIPGTVSFDVTDVDVTSLAFGVDGDNATPAHDLTDEDTYLEHLQDVNDDGFTDLVSHYKTQETGIAKGDTKACLTGDTTGGAPLVGDDVDSGLACDSVRTVGGKK